MCVGEEAGGQAAAEKEEDGRFLRRDKDAGCSATMLASLSQENVTRGRGALDELHGAARRCTACEASVHAWVSGWVRAMCVR